ncbi:MAG: hypothetical protein ACRDO2_04035 [Nocardioidaceae bacterium]
MNIRRFRALHAAGASYVEIAREWGCDWRTVRKYLAEALPRSAAELAESDENPLTGLRRRFEVVSRAGARLG